MGTVRWDKEKALGRWTVKPAFYPVLNAAVDKIINFILGMTMD
jgi:hypothetical protein